MGCIRFYEQLPVFHLALFALNSCLVGSPAPLLKGTAKANFVSGTTAEVELSKSYASSVLAAWRPGGGAKDDIQCQSHSSNEELLQRWI